MFLVAAIFNFLTLNSIQRFVEVGGYYVIFGLLFSCGLGLPLPEDIPLILGGYFSATGHLDLGIVAIVAWFGIIGGDCVLYHLGKKYGLNITRVPVLGKHIHTDRIRSTELLFHRWGVWVIGIGRMLAGVRGVIVFTAGTIKYNFVSFLIADGLGAVVSGGLFLMLGFWAGRTFGDLNALRAKIQHYEHWVFGGVGLVVAVLVAIKLYRRKQHKPRLTDVALGKAAEKAAEHPIKDKTDERPTPNVQRSTPNVDR